MTAARAVIRRPYTALHLGFVLAAGRALAIAPATVAPASPAPARGLHASAAPRRAAHVTACDPSWCALARPSDAELAAIGADANRMLARYAADSTALGRQCRALGATMRARAGDVRMIPYMWRVEDPDGNLEPVTGDAHLVELVPGTGTVHIARGYDALNPDRGLPAILQTARHEFAHLNGARQSVGGFDAAAQLARECGPDGAQGFGGGPDNAL